MLKVLFVDDDEQVLQGLKRSLRPLRDEWDMTFIGSGQDALDYVQSTDIDMIVSDIRMPGIDGVQLLSTIRDTHPRVIRMALSGHADKDMELQCAAAAHQFLAKPTSAEELKESMVRASCMIKLLNSSELRAATGGLKSLPSIPRLYQQITEEIAKPNCSTQAIADIVDKDVSMSAKVLQLVNSAFFGLSTNVESISKAVGLLGIDTLRSLVLAEEAFISFAEAESSGINLDMLSGHSLKTATLAQAISKHQGQSRKEAETAFMAGIVHNIGKLVLAHSFPARYRNVTEMVREGDSYYHAEQLEFGVSHPQVGGYLLGIWGLPYLVVEATAFHHYPSDAESDSVFAPLSAVYLAISLIKAQEMNMDIDQLKDSLDQDYINYVADMSELEAWMALAADLTG